MFLRNLECTGGGIPLVFRVGIGEKEPVTLCLLDSNPEGMILAYPAIGQSAGFHKAQVWNLHHEAAYDAGGGNVARWLQRFGDDPDLLVEQIPFAETQNYVSAVTRKAEAYA